MGALDFGGIATLHEQNQSIKESLSNSMLLRFKAGEMISCFNKLYIGFPLIENRRCEKFVDIAQRAQGEAVAIRLISFHRSKCIVEWKLYRHHIDC